jgi:hypothetical protein
MRASKVDVFRSWQRAEKQAAEPLEHRTRQAQNESVARGMLPDDRLKKEWNK